MLSSNQQQIIEQAEFTYSPLEKAFDKQIKIIGDQGKRQVEALENLKPKEQTKAITQKSDDDDESLRQKETYNKLFDKKFNETQEISNEIDYKNLIYNFTTKTCGSINFIKIKGSFGLFKKIRDGDISLKQQKWIKKNLKENQVK